MNSIRDLLPTLAVTGLLFTPGASATPLCENACEMVVEFTVGGRIEAVEALTFTFGEGGLIDLGDGTVMAFGSGGVLELPAGEAWVFAAGGQLYLGAEGNIEYSDANILINGDLTLLDNGDGTVTLLGSWAIGGGGTVLLESAATFSANVDFSGAGSVTLGSGFFTPQVPATPIQIDPGTLNPGVISGGVVIGSGAVTIGNTGSIDFGSGSVIVVQPSTPIDISEGGTLTGGGTITLNPIIDPVTVQPSTPIDISGGGTLTGGGIITLNPTIDPVPENPLQPTHVVQLDLSSGTEASNVISVDAQGVLFFDGQRVLINHGATLELASFEPIKVSDFVTLQGMQIPIADDLSCTVTHESCIDAQGREYVPVEGKLVLAGQDSTLADTTQQESSMEEGSVGALDGFALAPFILLGWRLRRIFFTRS